MQAVLHRYDCHGLCWSVPHSPGRSEPKGVPGLMIDAGLQAPHERGCPPRAAVRPDRARSPDHRDPLRPPGVGRPTAGGRWPAPPDTAMRSCFILGELGFYLSERAQGGRNAGVLPPEQPTPNVQRRSEVRVGRGEPCPLSEYGAPVSERAASSSLRSHAPSGRAGRLFPEGCPPAQAAPTRDE